MEAPRSSGPRVGSCRICQQSIGHNEVARGGLCGAPACRHADTTARVRALEVERRTRQEIEARQTAADLAAWGAKVRDVPADAVAGAVVPARETRLAPASARRQGQFRDALTKVITQAMVLRAPGDRASATASAPDPDPPRAAQTLGAGCGTCGGRCCGFGGTHAFLSPRDLRWFMDANPTLRPADVLAAYLDRLPARAYADSCVYHTPSGCALPRTMRSHICERYLCEGLIALRARLAERPAAEVVIAARVRGAVVRLNVLRGDDSLVPLPPEDLPADLRQR